jgi:NAD(P)H-nitrite reductase large subunit
MEHIVIIGNGIAGVTTARHIRKYSDHRITVISAESDYFFSRTALMYVYMGHMRWNDIVPYEESFWAKNRIGLLRGYVSSVDADAKLVHLDDGARLAFDKLVLATGSETNTFGWEGQDLDEVIGLVSKQDLGKLEAIAPNNKVCPNAVIVGGGLIGVELAEMLLSRGIDVTFLVRESAFWTGVLPPGEAQMISRHIFSHGVDLRHETHLEKILADGEGRVRAVKTTAGEEIACRLVGITTGVKPNIGFLKGSQIETNRGILVNRFLETNIPGIYAIGDCAEQRDPIGNRPAVEAVWYTGRMMGEALAQTLCGNKTQYSPGHWFNSAKFFDIEYQTYGWVFPEHRRKDYETQFHWIHRDDDKCITVSYHAESRKFLGINTFGIRMRHDVFDNWLTAGKSVDYVIDNLRVANFDPEFYDSYHKEIQTSFSLQQKNMAI